MRVIFIGPPGSGKGTQARRLASRFAVPHISTGDILREAIVSGSELGRAAEPIMAAGGLVPDDLMIGIIRDRMRQPDAQDGFIMDGFPRTLPQAEKFFRIIGNDGEPLHVIRMLVPDEVIVRRISLRRTCVQCGAIYHLENQRPTKDGICDRCGAAVEARPDDHEGTVRARLQAFHDQTLPVVEFYRSCNLLQEVDGVGPVDEVFERIVKTLV